MARTEYDDDPADLTGTEPEPGARRATVRAYFAVFTPECL